MANLMLGQIQGNILSGFNKDYQNLLFLRFTDRGRAREWIHTLVNEVATAQEIADYATLFKSLKRRRGGELGLLKMTWMNIAFTFNGLQQLGVNDADLEQFPTAFRAGMSARKKILGDLNDSDPGTWLAPFRGGQIHAVMIVAADSAADLGEQSRRYCHNMGVYGVHLVYLQEGAVRQDQPGHEHFGFRDGISQPGIRGVDPPLTENPDQGDPGQDLLHPGEFVLGYPTQIPTAKPGFDGPNPDPGPLSPQHQGKDEPAPAWAQNGSYLVFRRLAQDVPKFQEQLDNLAAQLGVSVEVAGAKLVGRYFSGAPLEFTKDETNWINANSLSKGFDPATGDPTALLNELKLIDGSFGGDDMFNNNFEYGGDVQGTTVPRAAHIRKVYPRDEKSSKGGDESSTQTHRILRRGIPFGTSFRPSLGAIAHHPAAAVEAPGDRGLLFLCYQSSIERQFEFIQQKWVQNPDFPEDGDGVDPVVAQGVPSPFSCPGGKTAKVTLAHFVTNTGGEYFFQPSIEALDKTLSSG